jgi:hypothetical protein
MTIKFSSIKAFRIIRKALFCFRSNYYILAAFCIATSCTKELNYELNDTKSLVINSVFHPGSEFSFHISNTSSPLQRYDSIHEKLNFLLYEGNSIIMDTLIHSGFLITNIHPKSNTKYRIEVSSENLPSISSIDSIPDKVSIHEATVVFPAGVDDYGDYYAEASIVFIDPADKKNFYELLVYAFNGFNKHYWRGPQNFLITDPVLLNEGDVDYDPSSFFFSDELFNGETCTIQVKGFMFHSINTEGPKPSGQLFAVLRSVSEPYYLYRKYFTRHTYNQQFQGNFLDLIFQGEPQPMYTNVTNGYGIFAGYQETVKEIIHVK